MASTCAAFAVAPALHNRSRRRVHRSRRTHALRARGVVRSYAALSDCKEVVLQSEDVSEEGFAPFGQLIRATPDGTPYSPGTLDCELDLAQGTPRFYIMQLPPKGHQFDRITYHSKVTQCLGSLGATPWYIAVAKPSDLSRPPREEDIKVFRVERGVFVKFDTATWHAGPLFEGEDDMDFYNLELSDTNVVDHNTHVFSTRDKIVFKIAPPS